MGVCFEFCCLQLARGANVNRHVLSRPYRGDALQVPVVSRAAVFIRKDMPIGGDEPQQLPLFEKVLRILRPEAQRGLRTRKRLIEKKTARL